MSYAGSGGDDQSEDGELRHSPDAKKPEEVLDFSLSEDDADTADSLDIKPPQATRVAHGSGKAKRREKTREPGRRHARSERHRDPERSHAHREKHHRLREQKYDYREYRSARYADAQYRYADKRSKESDRYLDKELRYLQAEEKRGKSAVDQTLDDLRERLLDKRRTKDDDRGHERRKREETLVEDPDAYVKEIIDLSTSEDVAGGVAPRKEKWTREELQEQEMRRERLLEAEREIARQKEQYRQDRERRHQQRAQRQEAKRKLEAAVAAGTTHKRQRISTELSQYKNKALSIVTVSDNSESGSDKSARSEKSEHSDDSERDSSSEESRRSDNSDYREQSPMSVGNLAKSDRSSSRSRSASVHSDGGQAEAVEEAVAVESEKSPEAAPVVAAVAEPAPTTDERLPPYLPAIQGCRSVEEFQCLNRIEEGTYGVVYRARDKRTQEIVALKRLKMEKEKEGFPITSLREINTLLKGQHPNIVTVREIVVGSNMDKIFIVMDYVEHDLKSLMETMRHKKQVFVPGEVKCLLRQLLGAVAHLHDNWILHRDLKTSNLLLSHKGILKVGDFGLAREYGSPLKAYTPIVVTLWYRAPELLLCAKEYSTPIDMWSVGCIFAELLLMNALFPGKSEVDQLNRIFKDLGTPNEKIWPGYNELPAVKKMKFTEFPMSQLRNRFSMLSDLGRSLLQRFLTYDPSQRVTAEDALKHDFFTEAPLPIDPAMFPTWPAKSELGHRKALAASPKPPSGGREYKQLGDGDEDSAIGFHMGANSATSLLEARRLAMGAGFSLKF